MRQQQIKFTTLLDAWNYARRHGIKRKPRRVSLHEWVL